MICLFHMPWQNQIPGNTLPLSSLAKPVWASISTRRYNKGILRPATLSLYDKVTENYIGSTRLYDIQLKHKTTQLGYTWYSIASRGTGINKHCKYLLLQFAFETLGFERVEFRADLRNELSIAAMKSIGCTVEGVLRKSMILSNGDRRDSIVLSILKSEWESGIKTSLKERLK